MLGLVGSTRLLVSANAQLGSMKHLIAPIFAIAALALALPTTVIVPDIVGNEYMFPHGRILDKGDAGILLPDGTAVK